MADYIFTQSGDNNVQIGDVTGMPYHVETALKWALEHNFQSVAAQYSKTLALEVVRLRDENERLCVALKLAQARAGDAEAEVERLRALVDGVYTIAQEEKFEEVEALIDNARWRERQEARHE